MNVNIDCPNCKHNFETEVDDPFEEISSAKESNTESELKNILLTIWENKDSVILNRKLKELRNISKI